MNSLDTIWWFYQKKPLKYLEASDIIDMFELNTVENVALEIEAKIKVGTPSDVYNNLNSVVQLVFMVGQDAFSERRRKAANLAKNLTNVSATDPANGHLTTFKDVLVRIILGNLSRTTVDRTDRWNFLYFLGNLFEEDFVSAAMMEHWVKNLNKADKDFLLIKMRNTIERELRKPDCSPAIHKLAKMKNEVELADSSSSESQASSYFESYEENLLTQSLSFLLFELEENPGNTIEQYIPTLIKRLEDCDEEELIECPMLFLEKALNSPRLIEKISETIKTIKNCFDSSDPRYQSFNQSLSESYEAEVIQSLKIPHWPNVDNLGIFLGSLYVKEVISNVLLQKYIEGVYEHVEKKQIFATQAFLNVLKITLGSTMKTHDPESFRVNVLRLQVLSSTGRIPEQYKEWKRKILSSHLEAAQNNHAAPIFVARTGYLQSHPTGAIPKTYGGNLPVTLYERLNQINAHNYGEILKFASTVSLDGSDQTIRKITNVIVTRVRCNRNLHGSASIILARFPSTANPKIDRKIFMKHLKESLIHELCGAAKGSIPYQTMIEFVCVLQNQNVIDGSIVKEILETVAQNSRIKKELPLQVLLSLLKGLNLKLEGLKETKATLEFHLNNNSSQNLRKEVEQALTKLSVVPQQLRSSQNLQEKKSTATKPVENFSVREESLLLLDDLSSKKTKDLEKLLSMFPTAKQVSEFATVFYKKAVGEENSSVFGKLAKHIDSYFESDENLRGLFKNAITSFPGYCKVMTSEEMKGSKIAEREVKFTGELYKIGWLSITKLEEFFDMLSKSEETVNLFCILIKQVALRIISNGHSQSLEKYFQLFSSRSKGYERSIPDFFTCLEVLETLDDIKTASLKNGSSNTEELKLSDEHEIILKFNQLTFDNLAVLSEHFKRFAVQSGRNAKALVDYIWNNAGVKPENSLMFAKVCEIIGQQEDSPFRLHLTDLLQRYVLGLSSIKKDCMTEEALKELTQMTIFISELYAIGFVKDVTLENLLKCSNLLSFDSIAKVSSLVTPGVNQSSNQRLKTRLTSLDDIVHEHSMKFLLELQNML